jgi:HEPN domain-containing protein
MKPPDTVARQVELPKTHDLGRLLDLVATVDAALAAALGGAVQLTDYSVDVRYPGDLPQLGLDDAQRAVEQAAEVLDRITRGLQTTS